MTGSISSSSLRRWADRLRHPYRLRLVVSGLALAIGYFGVYTPLNQRILRASRACRDAQQRQKTAHAVEMLQAQVALFQSRLSPGPDANECIQYVLNGVRALPLQLVQLDAAGREAIGPYGTLGLQIEVSGEVQQLDAFVAWLETNPRLFRIDSIHFDPPRGQRTDASLRLLLLALKA